MHYITRLFSKAPFEYLMLHMERVMAALAKLHELFEGYVESDLDKIALLAREVSESEHEADLVKNDIRKSMPRNFIFPVDRSHFLEILAIQDNIADVAEEIAGLLSIKKIDMISEIAPDLMAYVNKNMEAAWDVKEIVFKFDQLLESSFGGPVADETKLKIDQTAYKEHESDLMRRNILHSLFKEAHHLSTPDFYLLTKLIENIGRIAHYSEKVALRIGMMLDLK